MKHTMSIAMTVLLAGLATGQQLEAGPAPEGVDQARHERAFRMIQMQTFYSLPEAHRAEIIKNAEEQGIELPMTAADLEPETDPGVIERSKPLSEEEAELAFAKVSETIDLDRATFDSFNPIHQRMLASFAEVAAEHEVPAMPCFTPGTSQAVIDAFEAIVFASNPMAFQQTSRCGSTALNPGGASQGDPTILTYSLPADGVSVPNGIGEGTGPNNLNSWLDGIYGNRATWRALYDQVFQDWADVSGNTYILEPNDDNVTLFNSPGQAASAATSAWPPRPSTATPACSPTTSSRRTATWSSTPPTASTTTSPTTASASATSFTTSTATAWASSTSARSTTRC